MHAKLLVGVAAAVVLSSVPAFGAQSEYTEPGRFGVEGLISDDGFRGGVVYEHDVFELALDFDGSTTDTKKSSKGMGQTGDHVRAAEVVADWCGRRRGAGLGASAGDQSDKTKPEG